MVDIFQTSALDMLINPRVMSKLNTNSFLSSRKMVGSQKISVDNNRGKWGARVTVPPQLEGNSALLVLRQSLHDYRPKVEGRQILKKPLSSCLISPSVTQLVSLESKVSVFGLPAWVWVTGTLGGDAKCSQDLCYYKQAKKRIIMSFKVFHCVVMNL